MGFIEFLKSVKYEISDKEKLNIESLEVDLNKSTLSSNEEKMKNKSRRDCKKIFSEINNEEKTKYFIIKDEENIMLYFENLKYNQLFDILGLFNCHLNEIEERYYTINEPNYLIRTSNEGKVGKMKGIYSVVINKGYNKVQKKKRFYLVKGIEEELFEKDLFIEDKKLKNKYTIELNKWIKIQEEKLKQEEYIRENTLPIKEEVIIVFEKGEKVSNSFVVSNNVL